MGVFRMKQSALKRKPMKRSQPRRDWRDARRKVILEAKCRVCGCPIQAYLQAAHIMGRAHDRPKRAGLTVLWVNPDRVVPLCFRWDGPGCHPKYDAHQLDLTPFLTAQELAQAIQDAGSRGAAERRLRGRSTSSEDPGSRLVDG